MFASVSRSVFTSNPRVKTHGGGMWRQCQRRGREACEGGGWGGSSPTHSQIQRRKQEDGKCNSNPQHQEEPAAEKVGRLRTQPMSRVNKRQREKRHARGGAHFSGQRRGEAPGPHRIPGGRREGKVLIPGRKRASSRPQQSPSSRGRTDRQVSGRKEERTQQVREADSRVRTDTLADRRAAAL